MAVLNNTNSRRILLLAYLLFAASMLLPTIAVDLGKNGPVQPGYKVFLGGPVAAVGIILEPGGQQNNRDLGIFYLITWFANLALILPFLRVLSRPSRRLLAAVFTVLAWSVLGCFLVIPDNLIREIGIGYYLWAASITLILLFIHVDTDTSERVDLSPGPR
jgi:hypothetical protein